jgi:hydrogenase maturation protease
MEEIKEIANTVLYEGYLLYPYRRSALKNRQRWTIGVVYPRDYSEANGKIEPWMMKTECLVSGSADTSLDIYVRFLHLILKSSEQSVTSSVPSETKLDTMQSSNEWSWAGRLANEPWEEGMEREVSVLNLPLNSLLDHPQFREIAFSGERIIEDQSAVTNIREQQPLAGAVIIAAKPVATDLFKISVHIENRTAGTGTLASNAVMQHSFVSTHTILQVHHGTFISLLDPPEMLKEIAQDCNNVHTWPVLVGNEGECNTMLSSPIILYDYPQIAPESPGSLFDGTEIDEILTLRILTLTDEEKEEMRQGDERAREILERTEALSPEQFMKLHGVIRNLRPVDEGNEHE